MVLESVGLSSESVACGVEVVLAFLRAVSEQFFGPPLVVHDERGAFAFLRTDRAENVGRGGPLVAWGAWARAALGPTAGDLVLLPDPRLVGEPEFYRAGIDALLAPGVFQARGEAFLKSSIAPAAWA